MDKKISITILSVVILLMSIWSLNLGHQRLIKLNALEKEIEILTEQIEEQNELIRIFRNAERFDETRIQKEIDKLKDQQETTIDEMIDDICQDYVVDPTLIQSIVYHESRYDPKATNGNCIGLMQVSRKWHTGRAEKLGVDDLYDAYGNLLVGIDYISELVENYNDESLALMLYNMNHNSAFRLHREGKISRYAESVLLRAEQLKKGE